MKYKISTKDLDPITYQIKDKNGKRWATDAEGITSFLSSLDLSSVKVDEFIGGLLDNKVIEVETKKADVGGVSLSPPGKKSEFRTDLPKEKSILRTKWEQRSKIKEDVKKSSSKKTAEEDNKQKIMDDIISGEDKYFSYAHFDVSNMSDYNLLSDTINDMLSVYDINDGEAADIVQALTHGDKKSSKKQAQEDNTMIGINTLKNVLERIDSVGEGELIDNLFGSREEYIDTPGYWNEEKELGFHKDIMSFYDHNMSTENFEELISWLKNNQDKVEKFMNPLIESEASKKIAQEIPGMPAGDELTTLNESEDEMGEPTIDDAVPSLGNEPDSSPDEAPGKKKEKKEQPEMPEILKSLSPMDQIDLQRVEQDRLRYLDKKDLMGLKSVHTEEEYIIQKYTLDLPTSQGITPEGFIARKAKTHLMGQRDVYGMLLKASAPILQLRNKFPVILTNISYSGIQVDDYDYKSDECTVEWAFTMKPLGGKSLRAGIMRVNVKGDLVESIPYVWSNMGESFPLTDDGIQDFLGEKFLKRKMSR